MLRFLITILVMALMVTRANAFEVGGTISGSAKAIDGDTLEISGVRIRLNGVADAHRALEARGTQGMSILLP